MPSFTELSVIRECTELSRSLLTLFISTNSRAISAVIRLINCPSSYCLPLYRVSHVISDGVVQNLLFVSTIQPKFHRRFVVIRYVITD